MVSFSHHLEHTENILKPKQGLITSTSKLFDMFELRCIDDINKVETIYTRFINCKKATGLFLRTSTFEEMITKCVLNAILYYVGILWIISSN